MKLMRRLPIIIALALPSAVVADDDKAKTETTKTETTDKPVTDKQTSDVRAHVVPAVAGIESADKATAVLYALAGTDERMMQKDAQVSIDLARQALTMALERTAALDNVKDLSQDSKTEVDNAVMKLREARTTLQKIDKQVSKKQTRLSQKLADQIRAQAQDVHDDLSAAEGSVERIAKAYDVKTDLEFGG